jgi:ERCC4-type nuclease
MILIDDREENATKKRLNLDLLQHFERMHIQAEAVRLDYGDAAFEIHGPDGPMMVGVERKRLHDMLDCIKDGRYSGHQKIGMREFGYGISVLIIEGHWKPHDPDGWLMEGYSGGISWGYCRPRGARTLYSMLYRALISISLSGVVVTYSRDPFHTAFNIHEWYQWGQKSWDGHTSLMELHRLALPQLAAKPSLTQAWASHLPNVGAKKSDLAARRFRSALELANADESEWLKIPGIGIKSAQEIVREIWKKR